MSAVISTNLICILATGAYVSLAFLLARLRRRTDLADIAWGPGFIVVALSALLANPQVHSSVRLTIDLMVAIWGTRLAYHIAVRHRISKEDRRYTELTAKWHGNVALKSYTNIFLTQGFLMLLISAPVVIANSVNPGALVAPIYLGGVIWLIGFCFEAVGDRQLSQFLADPDNKGKLMTTGLWRYSRHPNYFGEITQWTGIFIMGISGPLGLAGIIGPLTISFLLLKVSGVPLVEKGYAGRSDWAEYKRRTSVLIPLPRSR